MLGADVTTGYDRDSCSSPPQKIRRWLGREAMPAHTPPTSDRSPPAQQTSVCVVWASPSGTSRLGWRKYILPEVVLLLWQDEHPWAARRAPRAPAPPSRRLGPHHTSLHQLLLIESAVSACGRPAAAMAEVASAAAAASRRARLCTQPQAQADRGHPRAARRRPL